jgi:APA family basic amino acid/polyamine antiporter
MKFKRELSYFDLTSIVVGTIVGADIYIASALSAGLLGPAAILVWIVAGICATIIALVFAYCSYYVPKVGGPFAFVSEAFDDFYGFLTGWSIWIAELLALPVFAIAFTKYLQYFIPLTFYQQLIVKGLFLFSLTYINIRGVKAAGRLNDILTIIKLAPLIILVIGGFVFFSLHVETLTSNFIPFAPQGFGNFGMALVLIFWAYVGFEMGTLPASEVKNPRKTIPKAIITGMIIVTLFYLLTNFVVYGVINWKNLAYSLTPLVLAGGMIFGAAGAIIMGIGALVSVSGSDESGTLGTARLSYAMSIDGLFPKIFAKVHPKYQTPYMALIIQGIIAFSVSIYSGLPQLISFSVFNLAFGFLLTCLALIVLRKNTAKKLYGQHILPWIGCIICIYLIVSTSLFNMILGLTVILIGLPLYAFFSPKTDIHHLKHMFLSEEAIFIRSITRKERFLANFLRLTYKTYTWLRRR